MHSDTSAQGQILQWWDNAVLLTSIWDTSLGPWLWHAKPIKPLGNYLVGSVVNTGKPQVWWTWDHHHRGWAVLLWASECSWLNGFVIFWSFKSVIALLFDNYCKIKKDHHYRAEWSMPLSTTKTVPVGIKYGHPVNNEGSILTSILQRTRGKHWEVK